MNKLITSSRGSDDLSIGSGTDRNKRQRELSNNKTQKGKNHVKSFLGEIFGFAEHQEKAFCGLA